MATTHTQPVQISPVTTQESRPVPDPTVLTTAQITRIVGSVKEVVDTRLAGMDKAIELLQRFADKQPTTEAVALQVTALRDLSDEKFRGVATQFENSSTALAAALQAAEKAVGKTEASFSKQIEAMNEKIDDLKDRLTSGEGKVSGIGNAWGVAMAVVMALIAIGAVVVMVVKQ